MVELTAEAPKKPKRPFLAGLLWWRTDTAEIDKQIAQYDSLKLWQSARGLSMLLCLFSVVVTLLLGSYLAMSPVEMFAEALIWTTLAIFMYRGHRWAFIAGMVLWTFEKGAMLLDSQAHSAPVLQVVWWAIYLNAFLLAFRVEKRKALLVTVPLR